MTHSIRLQSTRSVIILTTAHTSPLMDTLGIESHEEDIEFGAPLAVLSIKVEAVCVASHPGIALGIHLRVPK